MRALIVGGTGPTGPFVRDGLSSRGYAVTILHRGVHEPDELRDVEHIHADPHFAETLSDAIGDREWDVVIGAYGRLKVLAQIFSGRCGHFIGIGGAPVYRGFLEPATSIPYGMRVLAREDSPLADESPGVPPFAQKIADAERAVFQRGVAGQYQATIMRYSQIYGPRNIVPWEWAIMKRVQDGRKTIIVPDDGLWIITRCAAQNAAEAVLCAVDHPDLADGHAFNVGDDDQYTLRQWVERVAALLDVDIEIVGIPAELAPSALGELLMANAGPHVLMDTSKIRCRLGYRQVVTADEALGDTVAWLRRHPVTRGSYPAYNAVFDYAMEDRLLEAWSSARKAVMAAAPDRPLAAHHPMPHPTRPSVGVDSRGR